MIVLLTTQLVLFDVYYVIVGHVVQHICNLQNHNMQMHISYSVVLSALELKKSAILNVYLGRRLHDFIPQY